MTCEEFERIGLEAGGDASLTAEERTAAAAHLASCPRCAALEESWRVAKAELRVFAAATEPAQAPARVEMRLLQEFRTQHRSRKVRRAAVISSWGLAAAALILGAVTWINWRNSQTNVKDEVAKVQPPPAGLGNPNGEIEATTISADNGEDFTPLPGSAFSDSDAASIVRVRMQGSTLVALGVPVTEDRVADWIQVDLLVTDDGLPQAVRLSD